MPKISFETITWMLCVNIVLIKHLFQSVFLFLNRCLGCHFPYISIANESIKHRWRCTVLLTPATQAAPKIQRICTTICIYKQLWLISNILGTSYKPELRSYWKICKFKNWYFWPLPPCSTLTSFIWIPYFVSHPRMRQTLIVIAVKHLN